MSRDRRFRTPLSLESLEGKQLLSTLHGHAKTAHHPAHVLTTRSFSLDGNLRAPIASIQTYHTADQHFGVYSATGRLKSMGQVQASFVATLDPTETVMSTGRMTLSNRRGSVALELSTDQTDPTIYVYKVTTGTGAFSTATGSGTISTGGITPDFKLMTFTIHTTKL